MPAQMDLAVIRMLRITAIKQESINRANGFLRELGRNEMRSSYLYSRCKELARIARKIGLEFTDLSMHVIKILFLQ